jgi:hypothetical protein
VYVTVGDAQLLETRKKLHQGVCLGQQGAIMFPILHAESHGGNRCYPQVPQYLVSMDFFLKSFYEQ